MCLVLTDTNVCFKKTVTFATVYSRKCVRGFLKQTLDALMLTARIRMHYYFDSMNESFDPFKLSSVHSLVLVSSFDDISESYT